MHQRKSKGQKWYNSKLNCQLTKNLGKRKLFIDQEELEKDAKEFLASEDCNAYKLFKSEVQMENEEKEYHSIEEKADLKKRFGDFLDKMNSMPTIDGYDGQIVLCVSHAMFLKQTKLITVERNAIEDPIKVPYKYATVSCMKFAEAGKWELEIDGASTHFEKRGLDRYDTYNSKDFVPMEGDPQSPYIKKAGQGAVTKDGFLDSGINLVKQESRDPNCAKCTAEKICDECEGEMYD